jgi:L-alanine-DL-glutamate epimerase-like enolase superfamily enzyme
VTLTDGDHRGRGEAHGVSYLGETAPTLVDQLEKVRPAVEAGIDRAALQRLLPPGGARNALDCALWDLAAKQQGVRAWDLAGLPAAPPCTTDITIGLGSPADMAAAAVQAKAFGNLKLKLGEAAGDLARVEAVREARPDARLIVDANQGWRADALASLTDGLAALGVLLIEQPLPVGDDHALNDFRSPVPICADESCQTRASLGGLEGKYDLINIKLDKTGGLTEALALAHAAKGAGLGLMIGCMGGSSLAMAPAFVVAALCQFVDLDGPLFTTTDVACAFKYENGVMAPPHADLWV